MLRRHRHGAALAVALVALAIVPAAAVAGQFAPPRGSWMGVAPADVGARWFALPFSIPADDPANGLVNGGCPVEGHLAYDYGQQTCTVKPGTAIVENALANECSTVEDDPYHAETADEAVACGLAGLEGISVLTLTLDGKTVDVHSDRWLTPVTWTGVTLPDPNVFGADPGPIHFGGAGYFALIRPLPPGRHTFSLRIVASLPGGDLDVDVGNDIVVAQH